MFGLAHFKFCEEILILIVFYISELLSFASWFLFLFGIWVFSSIFHFFRSPSRAFKFCLPLHPGDCCRRRRVDRARYVNLLTLPEQHCHFCRIFVSFFAIFVFFLAIVVIFVNELAMSMMSTFLHSQSSLIILHFVLYIGYLFLCTPYNQVNLKNVLWCFTCCAQTSDELQLQEHVEHLVAPENI